MIASLHSFVYKQNFMSSTNLPLHTEFSAGLWLVLDLVLCRSTSLRTRFTRRRPLTTTRKRMEKRLLQKTWDTTSTFWLHRSVPPTKLGTPLPIHPIRFNHVTDCTLLGVLLLVSAYKYFGSVMLCNLNLFSCNIKSLFNMIICLI